VRVLRRAEHKCILACVCICLHNGILFTMYVICVSQVLVMHILVIARYCNYLLIVYVCAHVCCVYVCLWFNRMLI
jgi:hypothetical protein